MNSTPRSSPAQPSSPTSAHARSGAEDRSLLTDIMAFTPAATLGRELLALAVNLLLVGLIVLVIQPRPMVSAIMLSAVTVYMLVRLAVGFRTRGYGRDLTGGR